MALDLDLVSDAAQEDGPKTEPKFPKIYDIEPPAALSDLQLFTKGHPVAAYKTLRESAPVFWNREDNPNGPDGPGFWSVTRYEDVRRVDLDPKTFSSQRGGINLSYGVPEVRHPLLHPATFNNIICMDQPLHMPLRREHMAYFTPVYVQELREKVDAEIDSLLNRMADAGPVVDMVKMFSTELPLYTLSEMLGIPEIDRPRLIKWMHHLELAADTIANQGLEGVDPTMVMEFFANMQEMFDYGREALNDRRAAPRDDLLSSIANAEVDGELLPEPYLDGSWLLIIFAGNDTTRNSLSGTMRLLSENSDQKSKLINNPALMPGMVDEALRLVSPVIYMRRTATQDCEIAGQKIAEGEKVVMYYGSANRDESVFADAARFDIERTNAKDHIAFGLGPHVCLGQRIANMQLEAAYRKILARFPDVRWTGEIELAPNNFVHAISKLEISLTG